MENWGFTWTGEENLLNTLYYNFEANDYIQPFLATLCYAVAVIQKPPPHKFTIHNAVTQAIKKYTRISTEPGLQSTQPIQLTQIAGLDATWGGG